MKRRLTLSAGGLKAATLILFFLAAYFLARALMTLFAPSSVWEPVTINAPRMVSENASAAAFVLDYDPFYREAEINSAPQDTGLVDAPETTLDLTLKGIISGDNGRVTLQMADGQERSFGLEDEIISGVILSAIHDNYIVLSQKGRNEKLRFEREETAGFSGSSGSSGSVRPAGSSQLTKPRQAANSSRPRATAINSSSFNPSSFNQGALLEMVNLRRINEKGRIKGYEIKSIKPELDLRQMGLQDGDILVKLGGTDLTRSQANWLDAMQKMARTGGGSAQIIRNGRAMTVRIKMP